MSRLWRDTVRRVEMWFKKRVAYGQCLCPMDSRMWGSAPWPCIVCSDLRRRLRGELRPKNAIVSGGKKFNRRGTPRVWFLPQKIDGEWVFAPPQVLATTAYCIMRRNRIARLVGSGYNFSPFFLTGGGVLGIAVMNPVTEKATLLCVHAPELSMSVNDPYKITFFTPPPKWLTKEYVLSRVEQASKRLGLL